MIAGGVLSWFASASPDGLEWSMFKVSGKEELEGTTGVHHSLGALREKTVFLPDYRFRKAEHEGAAADGAVKEEPVPAWPAPDAGTSVSGIVGGILEPLLVAVAIGFLLKKREELPWPRRSDRVEHPGFAARSGGDGPAGAIRQPAHRLDPRAKIFTTLALIVAAVSFEQHQIPALLPLLFFRSPSALSVGFPPASYSAS